jgi:hypothetical protein
MPNYSGNLYKIRTGPGLPDSKYLSKVCPRKIPTEKERLYEENINLKQMYNLMNEENVRLKTKILQLEKNTEPVKPSDLTSPNNKAIHLAESLKQTIKDLKGEIKAKDKEIEEIKKHVRYTKMQELESDLIQYSNECIRLKSLIEELLEEKGILPKGLDLYLKLKEEKEELEKKVEEMKKNKEENKREIVYEEVKESDGFNELKERIQELRLVVEEKDQEIYKKNSEIQELKRKIVEKEQQLDEIKIQSVEHSIRSSTHIVDNNHLINKVAKYLIANNISAEKWVKSINNSGIISKSEFIHALDQDDILVSDSEIAVFMLKYGENDEQILSSVLIDLFPNFESISLSPAQIFELLKVRATLFSLKDVKEYLENHLTDYEISESDIFNLCTSGVFKLDNREDIKTLIDFILVEKCPISKEKCIETIADQFKNWVPLRKTELDGILKRFQGLLFDCFEELVCRLQEKTHSQDVISMENLVEELKVHGIINTSSEECCAKAAIYYMSKSISEVPYMRVVEAFYDGVDDDFTKGISDEYASEYRRSVHSFSYLPDTEESKVYGDQEENIEETYE